MEISFCMWLIPGSLQCLCGMLSSPEKLIYSVCCGSDIHHIPAGCRDCFNATKYVSVTVSRWVMTMPAHELHNACWRKFLSGVRLGGMIW